MTTKTAAATDASTPTLSAAEKAYEAATAATAAAGAALGPANEKLAAAKKALEDAQDEALKAITEKSADPVAAKERFQKARKAVGDREDDVDWALFELQAFEVADEQAHAAEQVARRAFIIEQIQTASREYNDPASRENVLISQLTATIAELLPLIADREELHRRLSGEALYDLSAEEKAKIGAATLHTGRPVEHLRATLAIPGQPAVTLQSDDFVAALTAGIDAAAAAQAERARLQRVG